MIELWKAEIKKASNQHEYLHNLIALGWIDRETAGPLCLDLIGVKL